MLRNTPGQRFRVVAFSAAGHVTGQAANITCTLSQDGGDRVPTSMENPTEIGTSGEYVFSLAQSETAGYELSFLPDCASAGVQVLGMPSNVIYTRVPDLAGPQSQTVTFSATSGGDPVSGLIVRIAGRQFVTGTNGQFAVPLDPGEYPAELVAPSGFELLSPITVTVEAQPLVIAVELTPRPIPAPPGPSMSLVAVLCLDASNQPEPGVVVDLRVVVVPPGDINVAYKGNKQSAISGADGIATLVAPRGAKYQIRRGPAADWQTITIADAELTDVGSFIGSP